MDRRKRGRHLYKRRVYPRGSKKRKKQKRQKSERKKFQSSQEIFKLLFYRSSEAQRRHYCGTCKRKEVEEHVVTDLDLHNDENKPSGAVAEERQKVSSQSTIDEMVDAITGCNNIGL